MTLSLVFPPLLVIKHLLSARYLLGAGDSETKPIHYCHRSHSLVGEKAVQCGNAEGVVR